MSFSYYIAKRYLFTKSNKNAINILTIIASVGVLISTLVLFILLSGFSGLRTFSYTLLKASDPDIKVSPVNGKFFNFSDDLHTKLVNNKAVKSYSKVVEERVFLQFRNKNIIAQLKGVDFNYQNVIDIDSVLYTGSWLNKDFPKAVVVGNGIAYKLSMGAMNFAEVLKIMTPKPGGGFLNPNNAFNIVNTQVLGVFGGAEEFQNSYLFSNIELAQKLLNFKPGQITDLEIKLVNSIDPADFSLQLQNELGSEFKVETREQLNALFYKVINTENFIGYLIGVLITVIALFNILGSIIMMIIDKKDNLQTIFKLGATVNVVRKIFIYQGFLLTFFAMLIGLSIAVVLVLLQVKYKLIMITQTIPYPVEFKWSNLLIVVFTIIILGYMASLIASSRIEKRFLEEKN